MNKFKHISKILESKNSSVVITPIIKKTRTRIEKYNVCPHCMQEIMEKSTYVDKDNLVYHRPCIEKGPIDRIVPMSKEEVMARLEWT